MTYVWEIKNYLKKEISTERSMPTCLLFSAHMTFTTTLHCTISLPGQTYSYKECTRQDI